MGYDEIERRRVKEERRVFDSDLLETVEGVFDRPTVLSVIDLMRARCIKVIKGVVASGKEARVFWGLDYENREVAVKIYYTMTSEFRRSIWKYLSGDPRYEDLRGMSWRKLIYVWTSKEYNNLKKMSKAGVRVPRPLCKKNNVLVMEFLGRDGVRYPLLKEAYEEGVLEREDLERICRDLLEQVRIMVSRAGLVHADLSEYNVMIVDKTPYIIDVSQAVSIDHPNAVEFLRHDIDTIEAFFKRAGVDTDVYRDLVREILERALETSRGRGFSYID